MDHYWRVDYDYGCSPVSETWRCVRCGLAAYNPKTAPQSRCTAPMTLTDATGTLQTGNEAWMRNAPKSITGPGPVSIGAAPVETERFQFQDFERLLVDTRTGKEYVPREMLALLSEREAEIARLHEVISATHESFDKKLGYDHSIYGRAWKLIERRGSGKHVVVALCDEIERLREQIADRKEEALEAGLNWSLVAQLIDERDEALRKIAEREAKDRRLYGPFPNARQRAERAVASLAEPSMLDHRLGRW